MGTLDRADIARLQAERLVDRIDPGAAGVDDQARPEPNGKAGHAVHD